jgi:hypothetical protein
MLQCKKLMALALNERREVLEKSGLCTFCLKHAQTWSVTVEEACPSLDARNPDVMGSTPPACTG